MSFDGTPRKRAKELLVFADGIEDAGHPELARRSRVVARDVLRLTDQLNDERSARQHIQVQRDAAVGILGQHAHKAAVRVST